MRLPCCVFGFAAITKHRPEPARIRSSQRRRWRSRAPHRPKVSQWPRAHPLLRATRRALRTVTILLNLMQPIELSSDTDSGHRIASQLPSQRTSVRTCQLAARESYPKFPTEDTRWPEDAGGKSELVGREISQQHAAPSHPHLLRTRERLSCTVATGVREAELRVGGVTSRRARGARVQTPLTSVPSRLGCRDTAECRGGGRSNEYSIVCVVVSSVCRPVRSLPRAGRRLAPRPRSPSAVAS